MNVSLFAFLNSNTTPANKAGSAFSDTLKGKSIAELIAPTPDPAGDAYLKMRQMDIDPKNSLNPSLFK